MRFIHRRQIAGVFVIGLMWWAVEFWNSSSSFHNKDTAIKDEDDGQFLYLGDIELEQYSPELRNYRVPTLPDQCEDNEDFVDAFGYACSGWANYPCTWYCDSPFSHPDFNATLHCMMPVHVGIVVENCCRTCGTHPQVPVTSEIWPEIEPELQSIYQTFVHAYRNFSDNILDCICPDAERGTRICEQCL